jgi:hypothetical protein
VALVDSSSAQNSSSDDLNRRTVERRAVEAVIWGMPAVNYDLMLQEMLAKTPAKVNEIIYWSKPADWKNQTLTPNPDAIYFMCFFNLKDTGPIVFEIPPSDAKASLRRKGSRLCARYAGLELYGAVVSSSARNFE